MKCATAFQRKSAFLIQALSRTTAAAWLLTGPCMVVSVDQSDEDVGDAVLLALDGSADPVPHPDDERAFHALLLAISGARSWSVFARHAACVEIQQELDDLWIVPTANRGPDEGYKELRDKQLTASAPTSTQIGAMLRAAFARTA